MKNEIEKNWDEMSKVYEDFTEDEDSYSYTIEWSCIKRMLPNLHKEKILDLGCGTGRFDFLFEKENPFSITGIDISENMLNLAKDKAAGRDSKIKFIKGDISNFNTYIEEKFDFIFSSTTFHYISDLEEMFINIYNAFNKHLRKLNFLTLKMPKCIKCYMPNRLIYIHKLNKAAYNIGYKRRERGLAYSLLNTPLYYYEY